MGQGQIKAEGSQIGVCYDTVEDPQRIPAEVFLYSRGVRWPFLELVGAKVGRHDPSAQWVFAHATYGRVGGVAQW